MSSGSRHKWVFRSRFRRNAFGWRSQPAIKRVNEAVAEIQDAFLTDPVLGAEGAVLFLEKVSGALAGVDSSSGSMGATVDWAVGSLVFLIVDAPVDDQVRDKWMQRLWRAVQEDAVPYIERLPQFWGELCVTRERASAWADEFKAVLLTVWGEDWKRHGYFKGTLACFSALFKAERYSEIMDLLEKAPYKSWDQRRWGIKTLIAMGDKAGALRFAESSRARNTADWIVDQACEEILLSSGMAEEAYKRYAFSANEKRTYLAIFRAIVKKYPHREPADILDDLVANSPGKEGKWFAAAKSARFYDKAINLARRSPCDPKTLTRAARDMAETRPLFATEAGLAALHWILRGYGYEITSSDVLSAFDYTVRAAKNADRLPETTRKIREMVEANGSGVLAVLARE
ncbi:MAG: hypothetical protein U9R40_04460, partial [Synergistota bacterium]|nr:hypothetical protein [Synergistota bacterium]